MQVFLSIFNELPYILEGTFVTLLLVAGALFLGFLLGIPMALLQVYGSRLAGRLIALYVWFFRGVPILLLLFLFYYGLFTLLPIDVGTIEASCIVLGLVSSSYQSQIFRGSIQAIPSGQMKAGRSLGMSSIQCFIHIILPQALRLSIPGWSNEYSSLLKDSAICFALGTPEIMARTHLVASRTYAHLPLYITAGIIYFIITLIGISLLRRLEKKLRIPGYTADSTV